MTAPDKMYSVRIILDVPAAFTKSAQFSSSTGRVEVGEAAETLPFNPQVVGSNPTGSRQDRPHNNVIASVRGAQPHSGAVAFNTEGDANAILSLFPANFQRSLRVAT